jgi:peroxiredoxin
MMLSSASPFSSKFHRRGSLWSALVVALVVGSSLSASAQSNVPVEAPKPDSDIEQAIKRGDGWLGVALIKVDEAEAKKLGYTRDLVGVENVFAGSPAHSSGFEIGDVIVKLDTKDIKSIKQLVETVRSSMPGTKVMFTLLRKGEKMEVPLLLGLRPDQYSLLKSAFVDKPAPAFTVRRTDNNKDTKLDAYAGKVLVVDFWATWCGPCRGSIPHLNGLITKFDSAEFALLGITDEQPATVATFRAKTKMEYPTASDTDRAANKAYLVNALPTLFIVDHKGVVREVVIGGGQGKFVEVEQTVARLIAERKADMKPR